MTEIFTQINLHENEAPIRTPYQMQRGKREGDWIKGKKYFRNTATSTASF